MPEVDAQDDAEKASRETRVAALRRLRSRDRVQAPRRVRHNYNPRFGLHFVPDPLYV
jgi:hypothetical protein